MSILSIFADNSLWNCVRISFHTSKIFHFPEPAGNEHEGRMTFYNMMILEGLLLWFGAAAAMGAVNAGIATNDMLL